MRHGSYCLCWEYMQNIILKEWQLVTNPGSNILLIPIRCLLTPEKASCQESGRIFLGKKLWSQFPLHLRDLRRWGTCQKVQSSIRIISFTRYFQGRKMKRREFHAKRSSPFFQFAWTIQYVIVVTKSVRNFPRGALNEFHTHLILQIQVRATFGLLACSSTTWRIESSRPNKPFWTALKKVGLTSISQTFTVSSSNGWSV
jgi:hypothetical protein